jgi:hypothetical protein
MQYRTQKCIAYYLKASHRRGHGIHSPFLFRLITQVIENTGNFSAYPKLKAAEENVRNMLKILDMESYRQSGTVLAGFNSRDIKSMHLLPVRFDLLLFRLVNDFRPRDIVFYGSTFGATLLALALADKRIPLNAQVANNYYRSFCQRLIEVYEVENIRMSETGTVDTSDFIVIQHPLDPAYCERILSTILGHPGFEGVIILCGIYSSAKMEAVWSVYKKDTTVRISLDLFEIGIFICRNGLQKEEFVLRF